MVEKEDIPFLIHLVDSLDEARLKLEEAHANRDYEKFNKIKKFILEAQRKISEVSS